MSLLPNQMIPPSQALGTVQNGIVIIDTNWWLLIYNIVKNSIGSGGSAPDSSLEFLEDGNIDSAYPELYQAPRNIINTLLQSDSTLDAAATPRDVINALIADDPQIQDPASRAQPSSAITVGGSPFTYNAAFDGTVVVTGGTVSAIAWIRQGVSTATGLTAGLFPLSRLDQLQVTYTVAPTMTFMPR